MKTAFLTTLLLLGLCGGCVEVEHPLSDPDQATVDGRLLGNWVDQDEMEYRIARAGGDFPAGMYRLELKSDDSTDVGYFFVTQLGEQSFLNVVQLKHEPPKTKWSDNEVLFYTLATFRADKDSLEYSLIAPKLFQAAVKSGELASREIKIDDQTHKVITNDAKTIQAFLQKHGKAIMAKPSIKLRRKPK